MTHPRGRPGARIGWLRDRALPPRIPALVGLAAAGLAAYASLAPVTRLPVAGPLPASPPRDGQPGDRLPGDGLPGDGPSGDGDTLTARLPVLAALPFQPGPGERESALAEELHHALLDALVRIGGLRVIGAESVRDMARADEADADRAALELGAGFGLAATIARAGDSVDVVARLVDARRDSALWTRTFRAAVDQPHTLPPRIAAAVASTLAPPLSRAERERLGTLATQDQEAFRAFHRAALDARPDADSAGLARAIARLELAVGRDPGFARAWAALARVHAELYGRGFDPTTDRVRAAAAAAREAERLDPDLPDGPLTRGVIAYWCHQDHLRAARELAAARAALPGDPEVPRRAALALRRGGDLDGARRHIERALDLDPRSVPVLLDAATTMLLARDAPAALRVVDRILEREPGHSDARILAARALLSVGRPDSARSYLLPRARGDGAHRDANPEAATRFWLVLAELHARRYDAADSLLRTDTTSAFVLPFLVLPRDQLLGELRVLAGDTQQARRHFAAARDLVTHALDHGREDPRLYAALGRALAGLGLVEEATAAALRATRSVPRTREPDRAARMLEELARVYTATGQTDAAVDVLERLLVGPSEITAPRLATDPVWDPLRSHPRFRQLTSGGATGSTGPGSR